MLRVVFMGTPEFSVPALDSVHQAFTITGVFTQPDKPVGRGLELRASPVKRRALELGLPVFQPEKMTAPGVFDQLRALQPEIIVVVAYGQILKKEVLELPRLGCVNIHSSLLPRWRGAAPIQRAILAGDSETGVTTMHLVEKLDAGDILLQEETPISEEDTAESVHDRLALMGAKLIVPTLQGLERGLLTSRKQDESLVTYAKKLSKEMEWLAPSQTAEELSRQVHALNPWPGTSVMLEHRLKIRGARARKDISGREGEIFEKAGMVLLGTRHGSLELLKMQWDGKKETGPGEFLNGLRGRGQSFPLKLRSPK